MRGTNSTKRSVIAFLVAAGALSAPRPAARAQETEDRAARIAFERVAAPALGRGFGRAALLKSHAEAKAADELRISGRRHLSGRVLTSRLVVEPGAELTVEPGTVIYVAGDMEIHAPITTGAAAGGSPRAVGKDHSVVGAQGHDVPKTVIACEGTGTIGADVTGTPGGDGGDVNLVGTTTKTALGDGGAGGTGGGFDIACAGDLTIAGTIRPGAGGRGGDADVTGADGAAPGGSGSDADAFGGFGGAAGRVRIVARNITVTAPGGAVVLVAGGRGGDAIARGGAGAAGASCGSGKNGGNGGSASAIGGAAGLGGNVFVGVRTNGGSVTGTLFADPGGAARGGNGTATAGSGRDGGTCPDAGCPVAGLAGGHGGKAGGASASGGGGGRAAYGSLSGGVGGRTEAAPGDGGAAYSQGGNAGDGGSGQAGKHPGHGGGGGDSPLVHATGGRGGSARTRAGGAGGDATARHGTGGDGGKGGDCCGNPGGKGGKGGARGAGVESLARAGLGGVGSSYGLAGKPDGDGAEFGSPGTAGADCPPSSGATTFDVSATTVTITTTVGNDASMPIDVTNKTGQPQSLVVVRLTGHFSDSPNGQVDFLAHETKTITIFYSAPMAGTEKVNLVLKRLDDSIERIVALIGVAK